MMIRPMIQYIKNNGNKNLVGVEVGVWKGVNAVSILDNLDMNKLFLIDPFKDYKGYIFKRSWRWKLLRNKQSVWYDTAFDILKGELEGYDSNKYIVFRDFSENVVDSFVDGSLDFVYIDGDHKREAVQRDLSIWYPKVKMGGVFGGHDFDIDYPDVMSVVTKFFKDKGISFYVCNRDYWTVKLKLKG